MGIFSVDSATAHTISFRGGASTVIASGKGQPWSLNLFIIRHQLQSVWQAVKSRGEVEMPLEQSKGEGPSSWSSPDRMIKLIISAWILSELVAASGAIQAEVDAYLERINKKIKPVIHKARKQVKQFYGKARQELVSGTLWKRLQKGIRSFPTKNQWAVGAALGAIVRPLVWELLESVGCYMACIYCIAETFHVVKMAAYKHWHLPHKVSRRKNQKALFLVESMGDHVEYIRAWFHFFASKDFIEELVMQQEPLPRGFLAGLLVGGTIDRYVA